MKKYLQLIIFNLLECISYCINTICALVGFYPRVELGVNFLATLKIRRVRKKIQQLRLKLLLECKKAELRDEKDFEDY